MHSRLFTAPQGKSAVPALQTRRLRPGSQDLAFLVPIGLTNFVETRQSHVLGGRQDGSQGLSLLPSFSSASHHRLCHPVPLRLGWGGARGARGKCGSRLERGHGARRAHRSPTRPTMRWQLQTLTGSPPGPDMPGMPLGTRPALGDTDRTTVRPRGTALTGVSLGPGRGQEPCPPLPRLRIGWGQLWGPGPTLVSRKGPSSRSYLRVLGMLSSWGRRDGCGDSHFNDLIIRCLIISVSLNPRVVFSVAPDLSAGQSWHKVRPHSPGPLLMDVAVLCPARPLPRGAC